MDAPQSRDEVDVIERELQRMDARLAIQWEPRAIMVKRGGYDAMGKVINPVYDGRWKVVVRGDPNRTAMWREDSLVTYVTAPQTMGSGARKVHLMTADGPYAPIGWWLVEHMRSWDRANREMIDAHLREQLDAENDRVDRETLAAGEAGEAEALDRMFFDGTMRGGVSTIHPVHANLTNLTTTTE